MTAGSGRGAGIVAVALCAFLALAGVSAPSALAAGSTGPIAGPARVGSAPPAKRISLELPLKADQAGLQRFAAAVATPGSPRYGQYEPVSTLARRFGAPASQRARVVRFLRRAGATDVSIDVTGLFADATMRVSLAQRLFATHLDAFHAHATAAPFVAPASAVRIPPGLAGAVTGVVGLDTRPLAPDPNGLSPARPQQASADLTSGTSRTGTPSGCPAAVAQPGFTPNQYLTAYGYEALHATGVQGQGERVALIEIDGFRESDLRAFAACFGLPVPHVNAYGVGIGKPLPPGGESTLDLELLDAAAPRLHAIDVYESQAMASDVLRSLTEPLRNPGAKPDVISASLGSCEAAMLTAVGTSGIKAMESSLALAAATGISVLASSGDDGSTACVTPKQVPLRTLAVNYPASSPWVTAVGGTNVVLSAADAIADPATDQVVWNDEPAGSGAGGGGISGLFTRPDYQKGDVAPNRRSVPDVSMLADPQPGYEIYCSAEGDCVKGATDSRWLTFGGTSAGTPLLAGGLALVDEELRLQGRQSIGFANPLLYRIARSPQGPSVISDVVRGGNDLGAALFGRPMGCCTAAVGYDSASGLGSVNLSALATVSATLVPRIASVGLTLPAQRRPIAAEHLLARVSCTTHCLMAAYAKIRIGRSGKPITRYSKLYVLSHRSGRTIRIALDTATRATLRAALSRHQQVTATVYGAIVDPSRNVEHRTRPRQLRLAG